MEDEQSENSLPALPTFAGASGLVKYVVVELDVARKNHEEFQTKMHSLAELMYQYKKWELVFAAYPITGIINRFVHIWKIPSEGTIVEVMREGALRARLPTRSNSTDQAYLIEYEFRQTYQMVQDLVLRTNHILMTSLSYDPENIGYQTQTVLIDAKGAPYLIFHKDLRQKKGQVPALTKDLEGVRLKDDIRRLDQLPQSASQNDKDKGRLKTIQRLLNRGVTDATLGPAKPKGQELLFNLAALRPTTIFEDLENITQVGATNALGVTSPQPKDLQFPPNVKDLLLAMPDGNVYQVDQEKLRKLVRPIPPSKLAKVTDLVKIFTDQRIPLASIPNDRSEVVGDGCACFVINLSSFTNGK